MSKPEHLKFLKFDYNDQFLSRLFSGDEEAINAGVERLMECDELPMNGVGVNLVPLEWVLDRLELDQAVALDRLGVDPSEKEVLFVAFWF